jgi:hypothetical protein
MAAERGVSRPTLDKTLDQRGAVKLFFPCITDIIV